MTDRPDSPGAAGPAGPDGPVDALALARDLIRCPSVTPADAGALDVLQAALVGLGFSCRRLPFGGDDGSARVDNLWARLGDGAPNLCFAGHTDVVPAGDDEAWSVGPFEGEVRDGALWGRGAADMKGAVAAFVAAAAGFLAGRGPGFGGSLSLLITGDEEGPAVNGTKRVLDWLAAEGQTIDFCLVGEPTNPRELGEMMKIGRRGSLNGHLVVRGVQGHAAYPGRADNPLPRMLRLLTALLAAPLDDGTEHFQPSNLEITAIDTGNPATNVIPGRVSARFNVRFNDRHDGDSIVAWLRQTLAAADPDADWTLETENSGDAFLTPPGPLSEAIAGAAHDVLGRTPEASTSGGTSDARFIRHFCPVAEFGLVGQTMHQTDEHVPVADIAALTRIYRGVIDRLFPATGSG